MFQSRKTLHTTSDRWVGAGTTTATSAPTIETINLAESKSAVIAAIVDVTSHTSGAFTAAVTDICTKSAHSFVTGIVVQVSNSGGALPTGLSAGTNYYVTRIDGDTFYLATTLANALAGTKIDITGAGSGTHTITPTAFAGGALKLQGTLDDGASWVDVPNETKTITADSTEVWELDVIRYPDYRIYPTLTAGSMTVSAKALPKR